MESFIASKTQSDDIQLTEAQTTDVISTLPTENGWLSDDNYPLYCYQGFWYHAHFIQGVLAIQDLRVFNLNPSDIIISSTPKSGTTWLKALSFAIVTRSRFANHSEDNPLLVTLPHKLIPILELHIAQEHKPRDPNLPLFATHLPYKSLPNSVLTVGCKIVYIWRDPKNAFISRWHFSHEMRSDKDTTKPIPLEEAIDLFCRGISPSGPYWDHVLGYWKAFLDHPNQLLLLKYEDMMNDTEVHVKRLAEFIGCPFSIEEEREGAITRIVKMCSFESLSNLEVNKGGTYFSNRHVSISNVAFFRKARVGDWKIHLTEEMANKIDQITLEKFGYFGLM